jgi:hypothetical protein
VLINASEALINAYGHLLVLRLAISENATDAKVLHQPVPDERLSGEAAAVESG